MSETIILTRQAADSIEGKETQVLVQHFTDRIFVLVTQLSGKIGCLYDIQIPNSSAPMRSSPALPGGLILPVPNNAAHLIPLLGSTVSSEMSILHSLYAAQLAGIIHASTPSGQDRKSVVLGIALRESKEDDKLESNRRTFEGVFRLVRKCLE